jgi:hypothetical protein
MPTVGKKKFAYTKEGIKKAKRYAKRKKRSLSKRKYDEGGTYQYTPPSFADMFDVGSKMKLFGGGNRPASERKMGRETARQERKMDRQSDRQERRQDRINYRRYEK